MEKLKKYWYVPVILAIIIIAFLIYWKRQKVVAYAKSFVGQDEISGNLGFEDPEFQKKMSEAGWRKGDSWCVFFAKMIWLNKYKADKELIDKLIVGNSQVTYDNVSKDTSGKFIVAETPKKGDIVIWAKVSGGKPTGMGHAGIVKSVDGDKFVSIEGNTTGEENSREGVTVAEKNRSLAEKDKTNGLRLRGFIRKV